MKPTEKTIYYLVQHLHPSLFIWKQQERTTMMTIMRVQMKEMKAKTNKIHKEQSENYHEQVHADFDTSVSITTRKIIKSCLLLTHQYNLEVNQ